MSKSQNDHTKPIIRWGRQQPQTASRATSEEYHGLPESDTRIGRKRKHAVENSTTEEELSQECAPRRSKRIKKVKIDKDFVY